MPEQTEPQGVPQPMAADPNYVAPPFVPDTEREHTAKNTGFRDGYHEGKADVFYALARNNQWAVDELATQKAIARNEDIIAQARKQEGG